MTKAQWDKIQIGSKVTTTYPDLANVEKSIDYIGTVIKGNSNWSQVLVKWDNSGSDVWYGRLGIEVLNKPAKA